MKSDPQLITFLHVRPAFFHRGIMPWLYTLPACVPSPLLSEFRPMSLNYIWSGFFLVGFAAAFAQWLFLGDNEIFKKVIDGTFESAKMGVMDIALPLAGVMTLWL
eukprot:gene31430-38820_t